MIIRAKTKFPNDELKELIKFVAQHTYANTKRVCINVRNLTTGGVGGRAYSCVPYMSNAPKMSKYLVTIRIGKTSYPKTNEWKTYKWVKRPYEEYERSDKKNKWRSVVVTKNGTEETWMEEYIDVKMPYGGKGSPLLTFNNWQEHFVAVVAHELKHIHQFQNKLPSSEVMAEKDALRILNIYRAETEAA